MTVIVIIPARYGSTRFPGKPLSLLRGKPLIQYAYEGAKDAHLINDIIVATDSEVILEKVRSFGGRAVMTNRNHSSGMDRIAEVAASMDYDIIVNVQADEPLIKPQMIDDVVTLLSDERASIGTLVKKITDPEEIMDPNVVKVVFNKEGFALYFSRSPIPFHRDIGIPHLMGRKREREKGRNAIRGSDSLSPRFSETKFFKHIGIYSYRREVLLSLAKKDSGEIEKIEKLEQLRALENGMRIKTKETFVETHGVDIPEDLERVEKCLSTYS